MSFACGPDLSKANMKGSLGRALTEQEDPTGLRHFTKPEVHDLSSLLDFGEVNCLIDW